MKHWLIVYDRAQHKLLRCTEYGSGQAAIRARFTVERGSQEKSWLEVVVLGADSLETVKRTHSRYFTRHQVTTA